MRSSLLVLVPLLLLAANTEERTETYPLRQIVRISGNVKTDVPCICGYEDLFWSCAMAQEWPFHAKAGDICNIRFIKPPPTPPEGGND